MEELKQYRAGPSGLLYWIEQLSRARVLVLGDIMLDRFVSGEVSRISPEGPVPVLRSVECESLLGGAGNVVRNLAALGARSCLVSAIGEDGEGEHVGKLLAELNSVEVFLIKEPKRRTTVKTRFLSQQQQLLRVDTETIHRIERKSVRKALDALRLHMRVCDVLIVSDYGKGFLDPTLLREAILLCRALKKEVLVDPKGMDYSVYRDAGIVTPNLKELGEATRMPVRGDSAVVIAAQQLIDSFRFKSVLATRSNEGMSLVESSGKITHFRSVAQEVYDVTGAGDTVIAALGAAIAAGAPLDKSAEIANLAAGIVVGKAGTAVAYTKDLVQALRTRELSAAESKVLDLRAAVERVEIWRRKGHKIGFINGFFELLHPAHIRLISHASKACDRLIVAINSDASVGRLKGSAPLLHETARSTIIASLENVDLVVVFQEDTPDRLLEILRPDVQIKGSNGTADQVASEWESGGKVLLVDLKEDFSQIGTALENISVGTL